MDPGWTLSALLALLMTNLATVCHSSSMPILLRILGARDGAWNRQTHSKSAPIPNEEDQIHGFLHLGSPSTTELLSNP